MPRKPRWTKKQREEWVRLATEAVLSRGGEATDRYGGYGLVLPTRFGPLAVQPEASETGASIFQRFMPLGDAHPTKEQMGVAEIACTYNPVSGKWNFHFDQAMLPTYHLGTWALYLDRIRPIREELRIRREALAAEALASAANLGPCGLTKKLQGKVELLEELEREFAHV